MQRRLLSGEAGFAVQELLLRLRRHGEDGEMLDAGHCEMKTVCWHKGLQVSRAPGGRPLTSTSTSTPTEH